MSFTRARASARRLRGIWCAAREGCRGRSDRWPPGLVARARPRRWRRRPSATRICGARSRGDDVEACVGIRGAARIADVSTGQVREARRLGLAGSPRGHSPPRSTSCHLSTAGPLPAARAPPPNPRPPTAAADVEHTLVAAPGAAIELAPRPGGSATCSTRSSNRS